MQILQAENTFPAGGGRWAEGKALTTVCSMPLESHDQANPLSLHTYWVEGKRP